MNSRIKLSARLALSGSQLKILPLLTMIIFTVFVFSLCNAAFNLFADAQYYLLVFSVLSLIVFAVITAPARLRLEIKHLMLAKGKKSASVKLGFSGMKKSLGMYAALFCLKVFWFAAFEAVPVFLSVVFLIYNSEKSISIKAALTVAVCVFVLAVLGILFYSVFIQRYSKAAFYLACYEDFTVFDAIGESVRKTRNNLAEILLFKLGFMPWFLLCIGIVPMLFVIPYYKQSLTCYFLR